MQFDMALDSPGVVQPSAAYGPSLPANSNSNTSSYDNSVPPASIAGIAIGSVISLALIGALILWCIRSSHHAPRPPSTLCSYAISEPAASPRRRHQNHHHHHMQQASCSSPHCAPSDVVYVPVPVQRQRPASASTAADLMLRGAASARGPPSDDDESGIFRGCAVLGSPGPSTPGSTVAVTPLPREDSRGGMAGRLGLGAGMGTGMLEGSGARMFPFNNNGYMVEGRGARGVNASNMRPSELAC
jgi:hypothetical protein